MSAPIPRFKPYYPTAQDDGEYVRYSDYAALEMQNRQLREAHYLSTACWHEKHEQCRKECKFCGRRCHCECHALAATEPKETK